MGETNKKKKFCINAFCLHVTLYILYNQPNIISYELSIVFPWLLLQKFDSKGGSIVFQWQCRWLFNQRKGLKWWWKLFSALLLTVLPTATQPASPWLSLMTCARWNRNHWEMIRASTSVTKIPEKSPIAQEKVTTFDARHFRNIGIKKLMRVVGKLPDLARMLVQLASLFHAHCYMLTVP